MSVVAVKKNTKGGFDIAADDIAVNGWTIVSNADNQTFSKIAKINDVVIGGSGSTEINSMLFMYARTHLIKTNDLDGIFDWFKEFLDWRKVKSDKYGIGGNWFIIVLDKKAYYFENFLCVEIKDNHAIGAGRDFALAALALGHSAKEAVEVACKLSAFCNEPVHIFKNQ